MLELVRILLPVPTIEGLDLDCGDGALVEAVDVDAVTVGVGARHVERFDPTGPTEGVSGHSGVETVGREAVLARDESKA